MSILTLILATVVWGGQARFNKDATVVTPKSTIRDVWAASDMTDPWENGSEPEYSGDAAQPFAWEDSTLEKPH